MSQPRGWDKMSHDEKLEALKVDLDKLYEKFDNLEQNVKRFIEYVNREFKRLAGDTSVRRQSPPQ
jgi:hypothetical protein